MIPVSELIHYHKPWRGTKVLPAEIKGKSKILFASKQRYEYMKLGNPLSDEQIKAMCKEIEPKIGYKLSEALYPVNPLLGAKATVSDEDLDLLKQWDSVVNRVWGSVVNRVWDNVMNSVWNNVMNSVWNNVGDSVGKSVRDRIRKSVWNSVGNSVGNSAWYNVSYSISAYIGSLFPSINIWKYKNHEQGQYPFQSAVNLWYRGLVPSFDGKIWRLHSGEKAEVVWEEPQIGWLKAQEKVPFDLEIN